MGEEVVVKEEIELEASKGDQNYLPDWTSQLSFKLNHFQVCEI